MYFFFLHYFVFLFTLCSYLIFSSESFSCSQIISVFFIHLFIYLFIFHYTIMHCALTRVCIPEIKEKEGNDMNKIKWLKQLSPIHSFWIVELIIVFGKPNHFLVSLHQKKINKIKIKKVTVDDLISLGFVLLVFVLIVFSGYSSSCHRRNCGGHGGHVPPHLKLLPPPGAPHFEFMKFVVNA